MKSVKDLNKSNVIRENNNSMTSSLTSSSSFDGIYEVENNWASLNKLVNLEEAVAGIKHKLNSSETLNYSIIHSNSLDNGLADWRRMYNVSATNPMIFCRYHFYDELPCIVMNKYMHCPSNAGNTTNNVLLIGIGYSEALRDQWMSENHPIKHSYVQQNPFVDYSVPDMDKMTVMNHTNKQINLSNVVKIDFLRT